MKEEIITLNQIGTWIPVPRTSNLNVVSCIWVNKTKLCADGSLERLKARLVAKGFNQVEGIDFSKKISPIVKPATIRFILTIAFAHNWDIRQLDVKNDFLNGHLHEKVFMEQHPWVRASCLSPSWLSIEEGFIQTARVKHHVHGLIASVYSCCQLVFSIVLSIHLSSFVMAAKKVSFCCSTWMISS